MIKKIDANIYIKKSAFCCITWALNVAIAICNNKKKYITACVKDIIPEIEAVFKLLRKTFISFNIF